MRRIFFKIFYIIELGWIDENAANSVVIFLLAMAYQGYVTLMKCTHCGHKTDGGAFCSK